MALFTQEMLETVRYGNTIESYLIAFGIFLAIVFAFHITRFICLRKLHAFAKKTKTDLDDFFISIVRAIKYPFYFAVGIYSALKYLSVPAIIDKILFYAIFIIIVYYAVKILSEIVNYAKNRIIKKRKKELEKEQEVDTSLIDVLSKLIKALFWIIAFLVVMQNFGYNVTTLVAGLGVGGIAIAFALQNVLSDIFASFSIYFDRPFEVGDFIIVDKDMGTVKKIGIKTTRLECLWGQEIVISNQELTSTRVNNYKKMDKRRIHLEIAVTYDTSVAKLKKIPKIIEDIFSKIEETEFARAHFKKFGDSALIFEIAYYVDTGDYDVFMDVQQELNLALKKEFDKRKIEFAYPTQTIFLNK